MSQTPPENKRSPFANLHLITYQSVPTCEAAGDRAVTQKPPFWPGTRPAQQLQLVLPPLPRLLPKLPPQDLIQYTFPSTYSPTDRKPQETRISKAKTTTAEPRATLKGSPRLILIITFWLTCWSNPTVFFTVT